MIDAIHAGDILNLLSAVSKENRHHNTFTTFTNHFERHALLNPLLESLFYGVLCHRMSFFMVVSETEWDYLVKMPLYVRDRCSESETIEITTGRSSLTHVMRSDRANSCHSARGSSSLHVHHKNVVQHERGLLVRKEKFIFDRTEGSKR